MWWLVIMFIVGVTMGYILSNHLNKSKFVGYLRIDRSDPEDGPYMFLELSTGVHNIIHRKDVLLKVRAEDYISHE